MACAVGKPDGTFHRYRYLNNSEFRNDLGWGSEAHGSTLGLANIGGNGKADLCGRGTAGLICAITP